MRSNSLQLVTLRLRRSWTRWSRKRAARKLTRAKRRLHLLQELTQEQTQRVAKLLLLERQELERLANPLLMVPQGISPVEMAKMELQMQQPQRHPLLTPGRPEIVEEPQPDPMEDLAQRLGLQPPRT